MFGYVTIHQPQLTEESYKRYRSYYCGLCKTLKDDYGRVGQLTLTFDMTFLVLLLSGLYEPKEHLEERRCIARPHEKQLMLQNDCTRYAADMNILLAYHNCLDDWFDDKSIVKLSTAKLLEKKYRTLEGRYKRQARAMADYMENVRAAEQSHLDDLDLVAGYTGTILGELFAWREDEWASTLRRMGFFLGKFIYLMDAYDDLAKDEKKQNYNPWRPYRESPDFEEYCLKILQMMMAECAKEFEKLPILQDAEILRNILYAGIWTKYGIMQSKKKKSGDR